MRPVLTVDEARVAFIRFAVPARGPTPESGPRFADATAPEIASRVSRLVGSGREWVSAERPIGFAATQLVASWTGRTPPGTWIEVALRIRTARGGLSRWY